MFNYFLGAALVVAPFFIKDGGKESVVLSQDYFLLLVSAFAVLFFGIKKVHRNIKIIAVAVFAAGFMAKNPFELFHYYQLGMVVAGVAFLAVIYGKLQEINHSQIFKLLGLICIIESVWMITQSLGVNPHAIWTELANNRTIISPENISFGSLGNQNHSGALIACLLPFLNWRLYFVPFIALYLGHSAMPIICAVIALIAHYSYSKKDYRPVIAAASALALSAILLVLGVFKGTFLDDSSRIEAWSKLLTNLGPQIAGKGFGYIPSVFAKIEIQGMHFYQAHNEWLEAYAIFGLLGVGVALQLTTVILKNKGNPSVNACLIALLVNSLGNFTFHIAPIFMVFAYCYAIQLGKKQGANGLEWT